MGWQAGQGDEPGRDPGRSRDPSDIPGALSPDEPVPVRDPRLSGFAKDGKWDACPPSAAVATALEGASGLEWRCPGASRDEMFGLLRQWQTMESWAVAGKLGVLRALIREDAQPLPGGGYHGDLPEGWTKSLTHEVALALSMPAISAERLMWVAWDLQARLPGTGALVTGGSLTYAKAKAVYEALLLLSDEDAAAAEAMILPELPGKTYGQVQKLAVQAAITVDPESATRRREEAERNRCRVELSREESAAALSGRDLPTDQALAAHASVCARAQEYKDSGAFPDDTRMSQFRAAAYLDLLNGTSAEARTATRQIVAVTAAATEAANVPGRDADDPDAPPSSADDSGSDDDGPDDDDPGEDRPYDGGPDDQGPGGGPPGSPGNSSSPRSPRTSSPRLADLVLPLVTLLGLAERPGEGHALGPLDPDLCRALAAAAVASPDSALCVTITDPDGIAIGHGCTRVTRRNSRLAEALAGSGVHTGLTLPARVNLTIPASRLIQPDGQIGLTSPRGQPPWSLIRTGDPGPPGGFGTWTLTLPDGRNLTVELEPMPTFECDHRHESHTYKPNDTLRHLVQIRDYTCTFPPCSRHARESDFEHATPYHKGGRTCSCNAGARSRACHQVKQSRGWNVTQPRPGWHQWETPSGRIYTQPPKRYPA